MPDPQPAIQLGGTGGVGSAVAEADVRKHRVWIGNGTATFIVTVLVILLFGGYVTTLTMFPHALEALTPEQRGAILGVMIAQFTASVQYWIGSSVGSTNKSIELAEVRKSLSGGAQ